MIQRAAGKPSDDGLLDRWRADGRELVHQHHAELARLIAPISGLIRQRRFAKAASAAQVAANHATLWHPGTFAHGGLDRIVHQLGQAALDHDTLRRPEAGFALRILHVATQVGAIGGHVRMMRRWIELDTENIHSVALTRQTQPPPEQLEAATTASGGCIHYVNARMGGPRAWARALQPLLTDADIVVLHVHNQDIIPFLALSGMHHRPRVILLNHADHIFWVGAGLVDVVVNTRRSGGVLSAGRRHIPAERNLLLPLCLEPGGRIDSRAQAKRLLGLPNSSIVILTIARSSKFRPVGGQSFADALMPVLRADPRVHLVAVGPGGTEDWSAAMAQVPGRIITHPERPDTRSFLEAADIYLDSFPFPSITSLFEAGLFGLPLVTRAAFGPGCEIMEAELDRDRRGASACRDCRRAAGNAGSAGVGRAAAPRSWGADVCGHRDGQHGRELARGGGRHLCHGAATAAARARFHRRR